MKHGEGNTNSPELSLLNFLLLTYYHSHFLAATLDFTSFFTMAFLGAAPFFLQLGCFWIRLLFLGMKLRHMDFSTISNTRLAFQRQLYGFVFDRITTISGGHRICKQIDLCYNNFHSSIHCNYINYFQHLKLLHRASSFCQINSNTQNNVFIV